MRLFITKAKTTAEIDQTVTLGGVLYAVLMIRLFSTK